ncbi:nucleotide-binding universal stress UspA family protein [Actinoplanes campanulatus]|uniref:Nucleotide-binding universal stress UspA family protein n=1 Tax=Actinoplanes campanulatus TaxID=113559 RepID=A0A7W5AEV2_9ACTN|nr:universal stress protein [Actinoplanes campanulatus]MBB3094745.1 nucleotide-binding universal stress UspA family protein [Actinoplanes campanulatus]GGN07230.1 universal stress protein [Actinoplanes campanulatus]GID36042.1 universal stress protein [Actinoplanes campanulatus]
MRTATIVVATDGTASSRAAIRWAAREAARRAATLRVTHVLDWQHGEARYDLDGGGFAAARQIAEGVARTGAALAREVVPELSTEIDILVGNPAARLLSQAGDADLLVLGSRGRGGFASLVLGSVSQRVAMHAGVPVVVVRGRGDVTDGPVAVGFDESEQSRHTLRTAFELAAARGAPLAVIRTYLPVLSLYMGVAVANVPTPEEDAAERLRLDEQLAPWRERFPAVQVEALLSHDSAAAVLSGVSHGAQLVVVGSRGHGALAGTLLGSTGLQLLHHADSPVYLDRQAA